MKSITVNAASVITTGLLLSWAIIEYHQLMFKIELTQHLVRSTITT